MNVSKAFVLLLMLGAWMAASGIDINNNALYEIHHVILVFLPFDVAMGIMDQVKKNSENDVAAQCSCRFLHRKSKV
jgi:hypothetical protein